MDKSTCLCYNYIVEKATIYFKESKKWITHRTFKDFLLSKGGYIGMIAILYLVIWGIMLALISTNATIIAFVYLGVFTFFGWKALNKITPEMFVWMPLKGWLIYFVIKFILSFFIGMFVAPFQIAKMITIAIQDNIA